MCQKASGSALLRLIRLQCECNFNKTKEDYDEILSLFRDEHELNNHLFDLKNRGLITATFIPTLTGHILELSSLAYVNK